MLAPVVSIDNPQRRTDRQRWAFLLEMMKLDGLLELTVDGVKIDQSDLDQVVEIYTRHEAEGVRRWVHSNRQ